MPACMLSVHVRGWAQPPGCAIDGSDFPQGLLQLLGVGGLFYHFYNQVRSAQD